MENDITMLAYAGKELPENFQPCHYCGRMPAAFARRMHPVSRDVSGKLIAHCLSDECRAKAAAIANDKEMLMAECRLTYHDGRIDECDGLNHAHLSVTRVKNMSGKHEYLLCSNIDGRSETFDTLADALAHFAAKQAAFYHTEVERMEKSDGGKS